MAELDVATALRTVANRLAEKPWTTGIEEGFRALADELERQAKNLDPLPYIHLILDRRVPDDAPLYYPRDVIRFAPREDYEQDEKEYSRG